MGNYIGVDAAGTGAQANGGDGIFVENTPGTTIGGDTAAERNVISGNHGSGIHITGTEARNHVIKGNRIGTDAAGTAPIGNGGVGVLVDGAPNTVIGGNTANAPGDPPGNLISADNEDGVRIVGADAIGTVIQSNLIGTDVNGAGGLGNGADGLEVNEAVGVLIGGSSPSTEELR